MSRNKTIEQLDQLENNLSSGDLFPVWNQNQKDTYKALTEEIVDFFYDSKIDNEQGEEESQEEKNLLIRTNENNQKQLKTFPASTFANLIKEKEGYEEEKVLLSEDQVFGAEKANSIGDGTNLDEILSNGKYYNNDQSIFDHCPLEDGENFSMIVENLTPNIQRQTIFPVQTGIYSEVEDIEDYFTTQRKELQDRFSSIKTVYDENGDLNSFNTPIITPEGADRIQSQINYYKIKNIESKCILAKHIVNGNQGYWSYEYNSNYPLDNILLKGSNIIIGISYQQANYAPWQHFTVKCTGIQTVIENNKYNLEGYQLSHPGLISIPSQSPNYYIKMPIDYNFYKRTGVVFQAYHNPQIYLANNIGQDISGTFTGKIIISIFNEKTTLGDFDDYIKYTSLQALEASSENYIPQANEAPTQAFIEQDIYAVYLDPPEKTRDRNKKYYTKNSNYQYILDTSTTFTQGVTYYEKIGEKPLYYVRDSQNNSFNNKNWLSSPTIE